MSVPRACGLRRSSDGKIIPGRSSVVRLRRTTRAAVRVLSGTFRRENMRAKKLAGCSIRDRLDQLVYSVPRARVAHWRTKVPRSARYVWQLWLAPRSGRRSPPEDAAEDWAECRAKTTRCAPPGAFEPAGQLLTSIRFNPQNCARLRHIPRNRLHMSFSKRMRGAPFWSFPPPRREPKPPRTALSTVPSTGCSIG